MSTAAAVVCIITSWESLYNHFSVRRGCVILNASSLNLHRTQILGLTGLPRQDQIRDQVVQALQGQPVIIMIDTRGTVSYLHPRSPLIFARYLWKDWTEDRGRVEEEQVRSFFLWVKMGCKHLLLLRACSGCGKCKLRTCELSFAFASRC